MPLGFRTTTLSIIFLLTATTYPTLAKSYFYHRVKSGDSLSKLAKRYGTTVTRIKRANGMKSTVIKKGSRIKIPGRGGATKARTYRVRPGDSLSKIAQRHKVSVGQLARWNNMRVNQTLVSGRVLRLYSKAKKRPRWTGPKEESEWQKLPQNVKALLPNGYRPPKVQSRSLDGADYQIKIFAQKFARGHAAYLEVLPRGNKELTNPQITFNKKPVPLTKRPWGWRAIIGFSAYSDDLTKDLKIAIGPTEDEFTIKLANTYYPVVTWRSYLGNFDKKVELTPEQKQAAAERADARRSLIKRSNELKKEAFSRRTYDRLSPRWAHPRGYHKITSPFFTNRKKVRWYRKDGKKHWKKPYYSRHGGVDLAGPVGAPIYALADGQVAVAAPMYYEGNFTVVDHGHGVFSGYMHQSRFLVSQGQRVRAGQVLGRVGTTGRVTGPHLHLSLHIRGKVVDPLSIIGLPIR